MGRRIRQSPREARTLQAARLLLLALSLVSALDAGAEAVPVRTLAGLELADRPESWDLRIRFAVPIQYRTHSPRDRGRLIEIQVDALDPAGSLGPEVRESLKSPPDLPIPLERVDYEGFARGGGALVVNFERNVRFAVTGGDGGRSIVVRVQKPRTSASSAADESRYAAIMDEGRKAMVAQNYDRAIPLYTSVVEAPANPHSEEALEMLGLARQRTGQTAHAQAEFETYLELYPEGEGAARVRQRLDALLSARAAPAARLRPVRERSATEFDFFGSIYTGYYRAESSSDLSGSRLLDSSQVVDGDLNALVQRGDYELRGRISGFYRYEFLDGGDGPESRITNLLVEARDRQHQIEGTLGRQYRGGGGVLQRFDGARAQWRFQDRFTVKAVGGFPIATSISNESDWDRYFVGASFDFERLFDWVDGEVFGIYQSVDGMTDRAAIGGDLRYVDDRTSLLAFFDVDLYFLSLNVGRVSGRWRATPETALRFFVDYRNSPILTTRNALRGQPYDSIEEMSEDFSDGEIKRLAEDRTSRISTLMLGASHDLGPLWQFGGDFSAVHYGGTPTSGGVVGNKELGWEFGYLLQAIRNDTFVPGGVVRADLRIYDAKRYLGCELLLSGRFPAAYGLRFTPRLRTYYRANNTVQDFIQLRPSLRAEYRLRRWPWETDWTFDIDVGYEWMESVGGGLPTNLSGQNGYWLNVGLRFDF